MKGVRLGTNVEGDWLQGYWTSLLARRGAPPLPLELVNEGWQPSLIPRPCPLSPISRPCETAFNYVSNVTFAWSIRPKRPDCETAPPTITTSLPALFGEGRSPPPARTKNEPCGNPEHTAGPQPRHSPDSRPQPARPSPAPSSLGGATPRVASTCKPSRRGPRSAPSGSATGPRSSARTATAPRSVVKPLDDRAPGHASGHAQARSQTRRGLALRERRSEAPLDPASSPTV